MEIPTVRESFTLPFNNGEIWCEQMDCLGHDVHLIRTKFDDDMQYILRPSTSSRIMLALHETVLTADLAEHIAGQLCAGKARVQMLAIVGADKTSTKQLQSAFRGHTPSFALRFFKDYEPAKEWLLP